MGDLVVVPQKVPMVKLNNNLIVEDAKIAIRPLIAIFVEECGSSSKVIIDNEEWHVDSINLSKGENYAGKINRGL